MAVAWGFWKDDGTNAFSLQSPSCARESAAINSNKTSPAVRFIGSRSIQRQNHASLVRLMHCWRVGWTRQSSYFSVVAVLVEEDASKVNSKRPGWKKVRTQAAFDLQRGYSTALYRDCSASCITMIRVLCVFTNRNSMACHWWGVVATSHVAEVVAICSFVLIMHVFEIVVKSKYREK